MRQMFSLSTVMLLAACGKADAPPVVLDTGLVYSLQVEAALDPSATKVMLFKRIIGRLHAGDSFIDTIATSAARSVGGQLLVHGFFATTADPTESMQSAELWFTVDGEGAVTRHERPPEASAFSFDPRTPGKTLTTVAVDGIDTGWVLQCPSAEAFGLPNGVLRAHSVPLAHCGATLGRSSRPGHYVAARFEAADVQLDSWQVATSTSSGSSTLAPPAGVQGPVVFAEEASDGQFVAVVQSNDALSRFGTDGVVASVNLGGAVPIRRARRADDGVFWFEALDGRVLSWDAEGSGAFVARTPPAPSATSPRFDHLGVTLGAAVMSAFTPNIDDERYRVPLSCSARLAGADDFDQFASACTPCRSRGACRNFGESYLLGALEPSRLGLYAYWSWAGYLAFYTASLDRPEEPK